MDSKAGLYRGICVGRADPESRYRIQVKVPAVSGDTVLWAEPCLPVTYFEEDRLHIAHPAHTHTGSYSITVGTDTYYGTVVINPFGPQPHDVHIHEVPSLTKYPSLGQGVFVMYEQGDQNYPVWMGIYDTKFF